jgi:hypothetical protein
MAKAKKAKVSARSGKKVKKRVVRVRKKVRVGKRESQNKIKKNESPKEDHTRILCGIHDECYKLSNLIEVLAAGYSSYYGGRY